jgi:hypothetical protein
MGWTDIVVIAVILLIVGGALAYIVKAKKNGKKCIGCPYSDTCSAKRNGACGGCNHHDAG